MAISLDEYRKIREQATQNTAQQQPVQPSQAPVGGSRSGVDPTHEYKAWRDWKGNVNLSDVTTGQTNRFYQAYDHIGGANSNKAVGKDSFLADLGQSVGGALQRQGASLKNTGANLLIGMADLFNGKEEFNPAVGSALWRMEQGAKSDFGVADKLAQDSKYGNNKATQLVMDLTSGAVDLASDTLLSLATMNPAAGLAAMGARSYGSGAYEAAQEGKSRGQQFLTGLKSAGIEILTEKIGGPFEKVYGKSLLGNFTNGLVDRLSKNAGMRFALNSISNFSGEAVEEMLSDVLNPLADKLLRLDNGEGWKNLWTADGLSQMAYDGLVGGLLGLAGGAAEGLSGTAKAALISDSIDNAMASSQQGRSIGAELERDTSGMAAAAISNQASQTPVEAQQTSTQQVTPEAAETPENAPSREFNSKPEAETDVPFTFGEETTPEAAAPAPEVAPAAEENSVVTEAPESATMETEEAAPRQRGIGKKTGERLAGAAFLTDAAKQRAAREADSAERGVEVDASDFEESQPKAAAKPNVLVEQAKENGKSRLDKMRDARDRALAQNGIDYRNDPRQKYWNSELGEYNEIDITDGTHSEEEISEYLRDMRQIRLLDALDSWIDKNGPKFFKSGKNNNSESWRAFENAIRDEVQRRVAQQPNDDGFAISKGREEERRDRRVEAGEASREVAQDKADEARLKGKKRTQKFTENGFTAVPIGNGLYRVTGPSGNTSLEVSAVDAADAVQKYKDNLTEESRKAAKERKARETELKKMRDEVQASQEKPTQVEGSDGKTYEVTKQLTKSENNYEYVVTELDEDGLPTDMEAEVYRKNASDEKEAVEYAIAHPQYFKDGSVEGEAWGERGSNARKAYDSRDSKAVSGESREDKEGTVTGGNEVSQQLSGSDAQANERYRRPRMGREAAAGDVFAKISKGKYAFRIASRGANSNPYEFGSMEVIDGVGTCTLYDDLPDGTIVSNATGTHEGIHANFLYWRNGDVVKADTAAKEVFDAFAEQRSGIFQSPLSQQLFQDTYSIYGPDPQALDGYSEEFKEALNCRIASEFIARAASSTANFYTTAEEAAELDKLQSSMQQFLIDLGLCDDGDFSDTPTFSDRLTVMPEILSFFDKAGNKGANSEPSGTTSPETEATNAKEYAYRKKLAGETGVDEEFAKAAMPEDLDGLSERIKSSDNKFYGERKANIAKAAEAISKNIGKDASTVLPEDLADFIGKDFSQASKDIDGFAKEFLTALAAEDDGVALKTLADDLPKRIKKSKALKELLGDAETGNVAKMARVLAEAEDAKTAQNAASDLAEMIAKEAEEMPKRLKTLEQWDKNLSKRSPVARFLSGDKTVSQIASVYFGYQRDMINVLQGLDNFDKYGKGYGYELAKKILDANFKSQTALGNSVDHVLTAQAEFEKSGGANKTVELKMLKKNQWESHKISLAEAVDFLHTIRTLQASKVNAWQDITYHIGDQKLTISSQENFNRIMDALTQAVRNDKAANAYYQSFTEGYAMFKDSSKEAIRDASGRTVDMFEDGTYYPISSAPNGKASAEHDYDFGLDSTRYMQRRVSESGGVIQIFDPAVRFNSYAHTAANLVARAATGAEVERLNRGGLGKSITSLVEERYGKGATDTVKQYIKDSSNFRQESDTASSLLRSLRLNIQGGALFGNFGSMLKQYPSIYNAAGVLDFDSITHGAISYFTSAKNRQKAAGVGAIKTRHQGNLDPSVAEMLNENSGFKKAMEKLKILKFAKEGFEIVDSAAIRTIYLASEYQVEVKDNISRDSAEFNDRVMDYFIPAFLQTQPQFEKTLRPFAQTSDNELIRMFGMFKTQPLRNLNTMIRTVSEYNTVKEKYGTDSKEFKETEKQLRTTVAGQASASLMFGALGVLAKLLYHRRKDLEDKEGNLDAGKVMSRVLMNAAEASGGMLVFGDAAVQMVIDMASGGKTNEFYGLSAGAVSSVADALDAITTFTEKPNAYNAKRAAGYISTLFGIPLNNAYAILNSAIMYGKDISGSNEGNYDDILKYLDAQAKAAKKEEEKAAKAAAKEAEKSGADMLADTAKQNASQSELNSQEEKKTTEVSSYLKKPYQALLDSGMSSEKSQDLLSFIDTDDNNSIKQAEMFAFYKDNPDYEQYVMAMWNSYGYKTSWESYKAKHK